MENLKIALCGAQGTGKTTLMNALATEFGLTVRQQETKEVMQKYGFNCHKDALQASVLKPQKAIQFQAELIEGKRDLNRQEGGFITDRSPIDSLAYYSIHNSMWAPNSVSDYLRKAAFDGTKELDLLIFLDPENLVIEDNLMRTTSFEYYNVVRSYMERLIFEFIESSEVKVLGDVMVRLPEDDLEIFAMLKKVSINDKITYIALIYEDDIQPLNVRLKLIKAIYDRIKL